MFMLTSLSQVFRSDVPRITTTKPKVKSGVLLLGIMYSVQHLPWVIAANTDMWKRSPPSQCPLPTCLVLLFFSLKYGGWDDTVTSTRVPAQLINALSWRKKVVNTKSLLCQLPGTVLNYDIQFSQQLFEISILSTFLQMKKLTQKG